MKSSTLKIKTPRWSLPLLEPARLKGAKGGRASGKSHFFAELLIEEHILNPNQNSVCIREIQRSLRFSARKLLCDKIWSMGVPHLFKITREEIRNTRGTGIIIFQGMQDHTADSIKSLEGFGRAWVEEAQTLSARSMLLLLPTIRMPDSQLWFSWNPEVDDAPVEKLFANPDDDCVVVHVNFADNPFCPQVMIDLAARHLKNDPDTYAHVWLGAFSTRSDSQVFAGKWRIDDFAPGDEWQGPYQGLDFGFSNDPLAATRVWIHDDCLWLEHEAYATGIELDDTTEFVAGAIPDWNKYVCRADSAEPKSISYLQRHGMPLIESVKKWPNSVMEGVRFMRMFREIIIHSRCTGTASNFRLYTHKIDKNTDDILPDIIDANNHVPDAVRYAIAPIIKAQAGGRFNLRL